MIGSGQKPSLHHPNATKPATKLEKSAPPWGILNPKPQKAFFSTLEGVNVKYFERLTYAKTDKTYKYDVSRPITTSSPWRDGLLIF